MSNQLHPFERGTRFGRLHAAYDLLARPPASGGRIADYSLTGRQTRLAIAGHVSRDVMPAWALRGAAAYFLAAAAVLALALAFHGRHRTRALEVPKPFAIPTA